MVYIVEFDIDWRIEEVDPDLLRRLGPLHPYPEDDSFTLYRPEFGHYGHVWLGSQIFTTRQGAQDYINRDYYHANQYLWVNQ